MAIEQDIQQTKFKNVYQKLLVNLVFTCNWHHNGHLHTFKPYKLTPQEYNVLRILRGNTPNTLRINEIVKRVLDRMSNISRLVDGLAKKGLVVRKPNDTDRRSVDVALTPKGLELVNKLDSIIETEEQKFSTLTEAEAQQLNDLLDKLRG